MEVKLHTRSDGWRLFNPTRLEAKEKVKKYPYRWSTFWWLCWTRSSLCPRSADTIESVSSARSNFGLTINTKKTKVLSQETDIPPTIKIQDKYIKNVKKFVYLGSSIALNASMDTEINCHIDGFRHFCSTVWKSLR